MFDDDGTGDGIDPRGPYVALAEGVRLSLQNHGSVALDKSAWDLILASLERCSVGEHPVPPGWQLVPAEPNPTMLKAARKAMRRTIRGLTPEQCHTRWGKPRKGGYHIPADEKHTIRYQAMLAASPTGPEAVEGEFNFKLGPCSAADHERLVDTIERLTDELREAKSRVFTDEQVETALQTWLNDGWIKDGIGELRENYGESQVQQARMSMRATLESTNPPKRSTTGFTTLENFLIDEGILDHATKVAQARVDEMRKEVMQPVRHSPTTTNDVRPQDEVRAPGADNPIRTSGAFKQALAKVRQIEADLADFDGDRRGHISALGDAQRALFRVLAEDEDDFDWNAASLMLSAFNTEQPAFDAKRAFEETLKHGRTPTEEELQHCRDTLNRIDDYDDKALVRIAAERVESDVSNLLDAAQSFPKPPAYTIPNRSDKTPFAWFKTDVNGKPTEFTHDDIGAQAWEEQGFKLTRVYKSDVDLSLHQAYLRLRKIIPGAFNTPTAPSPEQVWEHTENCAAQLVIQLETIRAKLADFEPKLAERLRTAGQADEQIEQYKTALKIARDRFESILNGKTSFPYTKAADGVSDIDALLKDTE